jgi:hypothetical protein
MLDVHTSEIRQFLQKPAQIQRDFVLLYTFGTIPGAKMLWDTLCLHERRAQETRKGTFGALVFGMSHAFACSEHRPAAMSAKTQSSLSQVLKQRDWEEGLL